MNTATSTAAGQFRAARADISKRATDYAATMLAEPHCEPFVAAIVTRTQRLVFGRGHTQFRAILDACDNHSEMASDVSMGREGDWETITREAGVISRRTITTASGTPIAWIFQ